MLRYQDLEERIDYEFLKEIYRKGNLLSLIYLLASINEVSLLEKSAFLEFILKILNRIGGKERDKNFILGYFYKEDVSIGSLIYRLYRFRKNDYYILIDLRGDLYVYILRNISERKAKALERKMIEIIRNKKISDILVSEKRNIIVRYKNLHLVYQGYTSRKEINKFPSLVIGNPRKISFLPLGYLCPKDLGYKSKRRSFRVYKGIILGSTKDFDMIMKRFKVLRYKNYFKL